MAFSNPYANYKNSKVQTATPAQLTLMLYDGAIKFCNLAIMAIDNGEVQKAHNNIMRVQNIIEEFRSTLNFDYEVANDFDKVYKYIYERLVLANIRKDKAILEEVLGHLREMRETWMEVMRIAKQKGI